MAPKTPLHRLLWTSQCAVLWLTCVAVPLGMVHGAPAAQAPRASASEAATAYTIYVTPHSHIDMVWYWTYDQTRVLACRILRQALTMLKTDARFTFTQDQMAALAPFWESLGTEDREFFRRMIAQGRFEVATGMYVQPDVAATDFESLVRQYLAAGPWLHDTLGAKVTTAWNIDTYGQTVQMPQLFARAGLRYAVFMRDVPPEQAAALKSPFRWQSPDGSEVLSFWLSSGYSIHGPKLPELLRALVDHNVSGNDKLLLTWGTDLYFPDERAESIERQVQNAAQAIGIKVREVRFSTPRRYFEDVAASNVALPVYRRDFNPPLFTADLRGLHGQRPRAKLANRAAEEALEAAERFASCAAWFGQPYPAQGLREAWQKVLFNQHHDALPGSHTDPVDLAMMSGYAGANETARSAIDQSLWQLSQRIDTSRAGSFAFIVFNALVTPRTESVRYVPLFKERLRNFQLLDDHSQPVPFRIVDASRRHESGPLSDAAIEFVARDVPSLGWRTYRLEPAAGIAPVSEWRPLTGSVSNRLFTLKLDARSGSLASLVARRSGEELLDTRVYGGNELVLEEEHDPDCEGLIHLAGTEIRSSSFAPERVELRADAIGTTIRISGPFLGGRRVQSIDVYQDLPRIDFHTQLLGLPGHDGILTAVFPARSAAEGVLYETHNAVVERPHGFYCAQTWVDIPAGHERLALINQGLGGCHSQPDLMRLILLRSITNYRGYYSPGAAERGDHDFHYSLYPHVDDWPAADVVGQAHSFGSPLRVIAVEAHPGVLPSQGGFARVTEGGFEVTALKQSENGKDYILRGHETRGRRDRVRLQLDLPVSKAWLTDLLERPKQPLRLTHGQIEFDCQPFQFVTMRLRAGRWPEPQPIRLQGRPAR